jgi:NAD-dependent SIR2 family protein deacetylase
VGWRRFAAVEPNSGHRAVARLQRAGVLGQVVTQNVDGLHQAAGSQAAIELHGSLARVVCVGCGHRAARHELDAALRSLNPDFRPEERELLPDGDVNLPDVDVEAFVVPRCDRCEQDLIKPDVVFFGESVPKARVARCMALLDEADSLLVLGSSLRVFSGYRFVRRATERGIPVAIVTRGPTRADPEAAVRLDAALGEVLPALAERIGA